MTLSDEDRHDRLALPQFAKVGQIGEVLVTSDPTANLKLAQPE